MQADVKKDMAWSSVAFNDLMWPIVKPMLSGGHLLQMEGRPDSELAKKLDMLAGIDGWHIHKEGMRGIASRVQVAARPWNTFTVRMKRDSGAKTEFEKRKSAIDQPERGWIYPVITVQGYVQTESGPLLSCGVCLTSALIQFIDNGLSYLQRTSNAQFAVCSWEKMKKNNYPVKWWPYAKP